jgi:hypothetical protein
MPAFKLSEVKAEQKAKDDPIVIDLEDGSDPVCVPGVLCWSDEALSLINIDPVKAAKLVLGEKEYARYHAAGGEAGSLAYMVEQANGATPGE